MEIRGWVLYAIRIFDLDSIQKNKILNSVKYVKFGSSEFIRFRLCVYAKFVFLRSKKVEWKMNKESICIPFAQSFTELIWRWIMTEILFLLIEIKLYTKDADPNLVALLS